jgi:hypothetical protein
MNQVCETVGIRKLEELPKPRVRTSQVVERKGYRITEMVLQTEEDICLHARMFSPKETQPRGAVLYVHEKGGTADAFAGGPIEKLVQEGQTVLAVNLRGIGENLEVFSAYVLGLSYVGMRAEDILVCAKWLAEKETAGQTKTVRMIAVGNVGVPALHAAAIEPDLFSSMKLTRSLTSWSNVIERKRSHDQLINTVHGALLVYDLTNLAETLGEKLTIEQPVDAWGDPVEP